MKIRKTSSLFMVAIAAASFSYPVVGASPAMAQADMNGQALEMACERHQEVIQVPVGPNTGYTNLDQAVGRAVKALEECKNPNAVAHVVIRPDAGTVMLPEIIDTKGMGSIKIIGSAESDGQKITKRSVVTKNPKGSTFKSPVEIVSVEAKFSGTLITSSSSLTILMSQFTGEDDKALIVQGAETKENSPTFNFHRNMVIGTKIWAGKYSHNNGQIKDNDVSLRSFAHLPLIAAEGTKAVPDKHLVFEMNRMVLAHGQTTIPANVQPVVTVQQPKVHLLNNGFVGSSASTNSALVGIQLLNAPTTGNDMQPLNDIMIRGNLFQLGTAITNPMVSGQTQQQGSAGLVTIERNNFALAGNGILPKGKTALPADRFKAPCNHWAEGKEASDRKRANAQVVGHDMYIPNTPQTDIYTAECVTSAVPDLPPVAPDTNPGGGGGNNGGGQPPVVPPAPQPPAPNQPSPNQPNQPNQPGGNTDTGPAGKPEGRRIAGITRFETSVAISKESYPNGSDAVILARGDVAADSVSAVPLAKEIKAPVLLTPSDTLHPAVAEEIKRLMPKGGKITVMGGHVAISPQVEAQVKALGYTVERVAGVNRAATAVQTATKLAQTGKAKEVLVADGTDWQPVLIAGPAAAKVDGVTLLTNGNTMAPETKAYLDANRALKVTAVGSVAQQASGVRDAITAPNGAELSVAVARRFFPTPVNVGLATTRDFADALAGGAHAAKQDAPIILVPEQPNAVVTQWFATTPSLKQVFIYGGTNAITDAQVKDFIK